jgi:putative ABC transport system substrate-binding protein
MSRLNRRHFILATGATGLGLLAGCGRLPGQAGAPPKTPQVGYLDRSTGPYIEAFEQGLSDHGYVVGQNIVIRHAFIDRPVPENQDQLQDAAAELVRLGVDVIVAYGTTGALAAKQATSTVPIVFAPAGDPVGSGLVASFARPGGNATGMTNVASDTSAKRVELLQAVVPNLSRLAILMDPANPVTPELLAEAQRGALVLGLQPMVLEARGPDEFESAFTAASEHQAGAIVLLGSAPMTYNAALLAELAMKARLPAIYNNRAFPAAGGLMSYGSDLVAQFRRAAYYVDRILKGTKPADLPVEAPMRFNLIVNMKTARALGITFPNEILLQITEVIE